MGGRGSGIGGGGGESVLVEFGVLLVLDRDTRKGLGCLG